MYLNFSKKVPASVDGIFYLDFEPKIAQLYI